MQLEFYLGGIGMTIMNDIFVVRYVQGANWYTIVSFKFLCICGVMDGDSDLSCE